MAVLAVLVAAVALLGHEPVPKTLVCRTNHRSVGLFPGQEHPPPCRSNGRRSHLRPHRESRTTAKVREKYQAAERYRDDQNDLEAEAKRRRRRHKTGGSLMRRVFLGSPWSSLPSTLLSGRHAFWYAGICAYGTCRNVHRCQRTAETLIHLSPVPAKKWLDRHSLAWRGALARR